MSKVDISVIIPMYNCKKTIKQCVNSVLSQTYDSYEILLIDDGSVDGSYEYCLKEFPMPCVKVFHKENGGPSSARNLGIKKSNGKYLFFLDSDDYIENKAFENLMNNVSENKLVGLNYKKKMNDNVDIVGQRNKKTYLKSDFIKSILKSFEIGVIWGFLFDKSYLNNLNFDENTSYLEDSLFLVQYLQNIDEILFLNLSDSYYMYVINDNSITSSNLNIEKKIENVIYSLLKINDVTECMYVELIIKKCILLIEKLISKVDTNDLEMYKKILNNKKIVRIMKKDRLNYFSILFLFNNSIILKLYYSMRIFIKKILR